MTFSKPVKKIKFSDFQNEVRSYFPNWELTFQELRQGSFLVDVQLPEEAVTIEYQNLFKSFQIDFCFVVYGKTVKEVLDNWIKNYKEDREKYVKELPDYPNRRNADDYYRLADEFFNEIKGLD